MQKLRNRLEEICGLRRMDERMERDNKTSPGHVGRSEKKEWLFHSSVIMDGLMEGRTDRYSPLLTRLSAATSKIQ